MRITKEQLDDLERGQLKRCGKDAQNADLERRSDGKVYFVKQNISIAEASLARQEAFLEAHPEYRNPYKQMIAVMKKAFPEQGSK